MILDLAEIIRLSEEIYQKLTPEELQKKLKVLDEDKSSASSILHSFAIKLSLDVMAYHCYYYEKAKNLHKIKLNALSNKTCEQSFKNFEFDKETEEAFDISLKAARDVEQNPAIIFDNDLECICLTEVYKANIRLGILSEIEPEVINE